MQLENWNMNCILNGIKKICWVLYNVDSLYWKETNSYFLVVHIKVCIGKTTHCQEFILNGAQKKMEKRKNKPVDKRRLVNNGNCPIWQRKYGSIFNCLCFEVTWKRIVFFPHLIPNLGLLKFHRSNKVLNIAQFSTK